MLILGYGWSPFQDFESFSRNVVGLDEEDIHLSLSQYNSNFIKYEITSGVYSVKDFLAALHTLGDHERILQIKYGDISMQTNLFYLVLMGLLEC